MGSRIYLASSWRNPEQPSAVKILRALGHEVYDFRNPTHCQTGFSWRECDPEPADKWSAEKTREVLQTAPAAARGFNSDFRAMRWADTCVLLLPCGRSAHIEAGWMSGAGKRTIVVLADGQEPELMHLLCDTLVVGLDELATLFAGKTTAAASVLFAEGLKDSAPIDEDLLRVRVVGMIPAVATHAGYSDEVVAAWVAGNRMFSSAGLRKLSVACDVVEATRDSKIAGV